MRAHVDPGLRRGDDDIGAAEAERRQQRKALVGVGDLLAHEVLAGDAEMRRAGGELADDLGGREKGHFDAGQIGDRAAIVARAAPLHEFEPGAGEERRRRSPAAVPSRGRRGRAGSPFVIAALPSAAIARPRSPRRRREDRSMRRAGAPARHSARRRAPGGIAARRRRPLRRRSRCNSRDRARRPRNRRTRRTVMPRAARKPTRWSNESSAAPSRGRRPPPAAAAARRRRPDRPRSPRKRRRIACCSALTPGSERAAACSRNRSAISPAVRPPTGTMPAIASRSSTSALAPAWSARSSAASTPDCEFEPWPPLTISLQRTPLRKPAPHAAQPDIRQTERAEHAIEHAGVADPHGQGTRAGRLGRFQRERQNFRVRRLDVVASVAFEPGLDHLPALARARAKNRAEIGVLRLGARLRRGQVREAYGDRVFRTQAQLRPRGVAGQIEAAADFLAGHVEERGGGLQHGRLDAAEAGAEKMVERANPRFAPARVGRRNGQDRVHQIFPQIRGFL